MTKKRKAKGSADEKKSWERKPIQSSDYDLDFDEDWLSWILSGGWYGHWSLMFCLILVVSVIFCLALIYGHKIFFVLLVLLWINNFMCMLLPWCVSVLWQFILVFVSLPMLFWYFSDFHFQIFAKLWQKAGVMFGVSSYMCAYLFGVSSCLMFWSELYLFPLPSFCMIFDICTCCCVCSSVVCMLWYGVLLLCLLVFFCEDLLLQILLF